MVHAAAEQITTTFKRVTRFSSNVTVPAVDKGRITMAMTGTIVVTVNIDDNSNTSLDNVEQHVTVKIAITTRPTNPNPDGDSINGEVKTYLLKAFTQ